MIDLFSVLRKVQKSKCVTTFALFKIGDAMVNLFKSKTEMRYYFYQHALSRHPSPALTDELFEYV